MPRDSQGLYSLPAGNPVVPGTLIEAGWANPTMSDIGDALTGSLPRDGSAPMLANLTLAATMPTLPRHATNKAYVDQFIAYATGLPLAGIIAQAGGAAPPGFLLCDGAAVSRVTYADLFGAIGTIYGSGDNSTTFNLPNLQGQFIRGRDSSRTVGSLQPGSIQSHLHPVTDPGHAHPFTGNSGVTSSQNANHTHGVNDPGHSHTAQGQVSGALYGQDVGLAIAAVQTSTNATGISLGIENATHAHNFAVSGTVVSNTTGLTVAAAGGTETVPQNVAMDYYIKAVQDSSAAPGYLLGIESSDPNMIAIDLTTPTIPILDIKSNVALGTVKLDASGRIPLGLLPASSQQLLGYWDASSGQTPSQTYPLTNFGSGDTFIISVTGTLTVFNPVTLVAAPTVVSVGSIIQYITGSSTNPTGWYYVVASSTVAAGQVSMIPVGTISATNVQDGFAEVDGDLTTIAGAVVVNTSSIGTLQTGKVPQTSGTGAATLPAGTDAERPGSAILGQFRYNSQGNVFEGFTPTGWGQVGGGQMYGTAAVKAIFYNAQTIGEDLTVAASQNGLSAGPVTVNNGFTVTVSNGSVWSVA